MFRRDGHRAVLSVLEALDSEALESHGAWVTREHDPGATYRFEQLLGCWRHVGPVDAS